MPTDAKVVRGDVKEGLVPGAAHHIWGGGGLRPDHIRWSKNCHFRFCYHL